MSGWRKSSYSSYNGNCTEVASWRPSSYSVGNGECVEAGSGAALVGVRDSKDRDGPVLEFPAVAWVKFTEAVKGEVAQRA